MVSPSRYIIAVGRERTRRGKIFRKGINHVLGDIRTDRQTQMTDTKLLPDKGYSQTRENRVKVLYRGRNGKRRAQFLFNSEIERKSK